jgi:hypothetical protein
MSHIGVASVGNPWQARKKRPVGSWSDMLTKLPLPDGLANKEGA